MDRILHKFVPTNGINMHIAQLGSGPVVLLLHGFPEVWYSWRHQILALADAGFCAIAPDFRGYGLTENTDPSKTTYGDLVDDLVGLLAAIGEDKVFVVAKDFGGSLAYQLALLHPERVKGLVALGAPHFRLSMKNKAMTGLPDGHYIKRWAEPGRAQADFGRFDVKTTFRRIYILFSKSEMPLAASDQETLDLVDASSPLPKWLSEEDLEAYASLYQKSGFSYPIAVPYLYIGRVSKEGSKKSEVDEELDYRIKAPVLLVLGGRDYATAIPHFKHVAETVMKKDVPKLQLEMIEEGSHFVQEQCPQQVNKLILDFFISIT